MRLSLIYSEHNTIRTATEENRIAAETPRRSADLYMHSLLTAMEIPC